MSQKKSKLEILSYLNWDSSINEEKLLDIIEKDENKLLVKNLYVKSLETLSWDDLIFLWGLDRCKSLYTKETRRMLRFEHLREVYDGIFNLLQGHPLPNTGRSAEDIEKMRASFLFNRRNRCKQRTFSSPLLRRP